MIKLIPDETSLTNPLKFLRNEEIFLDSIIDLHCNESIWIRRKWLIKNSSFSSSTSQFYLPSRQLSYGIYQIDFLVTMNISSSLFLSRRSAFIQVIQSNAIAYLIPSSNSLISQSSDEDLEFNPGLFSIDPDSFQFNSTVSFI